MKTISRYIMTLALLITAATGAWAQTQWESGDCTVTLNNGTLTVSGNGAMADYLDGSNRPWDVNSGDITSVVVESGVTSVGFHAFESFSNLTSVTLPEGLTAIGEMAFYSCSSLQSITIPSTVTSIGAGAFWSCSAITSITLPEGLTAIGAMTFGDCGSLTSITLPEGLTAIESMAFSSCSSLTSITIPSTVTSIGDYAFMSSSAISDINLYANPDNLTWGETSIDFMSGKATKCHVLAEHLSTYQNNFSSANVTFVGDLQPLPTSTIDVTTNAASEQDLFTEAKFTMPASDATADYELVRDMSIQMTATMGDGTDGLRYRVKKAQQGQGYEPADMNMMQVLALVAVNDGIEHKDLTLNQDYYCRIYKLDEQTQQPADDGVLLADFDFAPGLYALKAFAEKGSNYDGETPLSNTFKLYDYINITFPKGYSTHYYNESLVLDEIRNSLKFYAVTAVTSEKVTLTEIEGKAIPGGTPFIVYNETAEPITAVMGMLQADDVTSAEQFKGTAEDKNMGSQSNCYILRNGDSTPTFRLVEGAGTLPAHRCYIDLGAVARTRSLGFDFGDGTTGIDSVESGELKVDSYYDLQGRKHQGTPQRKGVYVKDGRKVIVR